MSALQPASPSMTDEARYDLAIYRLYLAALRKCEQIEQEEQEPKHNEDHPDQLGGERMAFDGDDTHGNCNPD